VHEASCLEEPGAGKLHAGICEGGAGQPASLPRHVTLKALEHLSDRLHCKISELFGEGQ
jgi:hypothetical protein